MKKYPKKLLCALLAMAVSCSLAACRRDGGNTGSAPNETASAASLPEQEEVEVWSEPAATQPEATAPVGETAEPGGTAGESVPAVEPTEPGESESEEKPSEPEEKPAEPGEEEQTITETTQPQTGTQEPAALSYGEYLALSPAQQQAYYESFPTLEDFIAWHNAALAAYEANQDVPVVTGPIDIGDYVGS